MYTLSELEHTVMVRDARSPVALHDINEVISGGIWLPNSDICIANFVFTEDCFDLVLVDACKWNGVRDGNATFILPADGNRWGLLIQSDTKTFQLRFDDFLVTKRLQNVQHDEYKIACARD